MAAAIIPLIASVAPTIINLIAALVHPAAAAAEATKGAGTGPVKFAEVFGKVMIDLQNAAAAGMIPKELPSDDLVKLVIQSVVASMKLTGALGGTQVLASVPGTAAIPGTPPDVVSPASIFLRPGQSVVITGGLGA